MADIKPFRAYRPSRDKVHLIASRSYISYSKKDLKSKLDENPFTFLHVLNPDYKNSKKSAANSVSHFKRVNEKFLEFVAEQNLVRDKEKSFYLYRQIKDGHPYVGIIGCASVEDYNNRVIKKHEATIAFREEIFKNYLNLVEINAEPVCFTYPNHKEIDKITNRILLQFPEYDFTTTNRVRHSFWLIDKAEDVANISKHFKGVDSLYIADGHHRSASSALLGNELKAKNPNHRGDENYNYFMGIFIPESQLKIFEFNRLVKDLGEYTPEKLLEDLTNEFEVTYVEGDYFKPEKVHEIGMYLNKKWYSLHPKEGLFKENDPVNNLDVSILTNHILEPFLGISDLRTDDRIYFMGGRDGIAKLKKEVDSGKAAIAFAHFPVTMEQLKKIADADAIMPPKSTWIEPKLRSGLTVYSLNE